MKLIEDTPILFSRIKDTPILGADVGDTPFLKADVEDTPFLGAEQMGSLKSHLYNSWERSF